MSGRNTSQKRHPRRRDRAGRNRPHGRDETPSTQDARPAGIRPGKSQGIWLYGLHAVSAALGNPKRRRLRLIATSAGAEALPDGTAEIEIVDRDEIDGIVPPGAVHQGVALEVGPLGTTTIEDVAQHADQAGRTVAIALDQVTDPQNVGAVLRSAAAFGASAIIMPDRNTPEASGAMAKAASGALEIVPLVRAANLVRALEYLKEQGFWVIGFDMDAPTSLADADLPERCVLALGAEGRGLRRLTRETCDLMVRIPMTGAMESLNVSATAAVALYEWGRAPGK
jgi:23S rRNA (guanosine2251-2'-O)-methyltransferase